jgi:Oxidoreductase family, NAD-binding Rossmann fold
MKPYSRRQFMLHTSLAGLGWGLSSFIQPSLFKTAVASSGRIGIIGLDTSHSIAFTKALNSADSPEKYKGFRVVAAYPNGSADIESSTKRIPGYTDEVKKMGVEIVDSIATLLTKVDFVLLETNDGRPHLQQGIEVIKAGKPLFIDKPVAGTLADAIALYEISASLHVPFFSSSSLRYMESAQEAASGKMGKILGADCFSPATLEKTHPDLFWYGIHGVETLYTVMGMGCEKVTRKQTEGTEIVVGVWNDGRVGTFRGTRTGKHEYGGTVYGEKGPMILGPYKGYDNLLDKIIEFFKTGTTPIDPKETLEIYTFMEAADESKRKGGKEISLQEIFTLHKKKATHIIHSIN